MPLPTLVSGFLAFVTTVSVFHDPDRYRRAFAVILVSLSTCWANDKEPEVDDVTYQSELSEQGTSGEESVYEVEEEEEMY